MATALGIGRNGSARSAILVENEIDAIIDRELREEREAHQEREKKSIEALLRWWANVESLRGAASL